jgi:preprotein translocase subunit Sss1
MTAQTLPVIPSRREFLSTCLHSLAGIAIVGTVVVDSLVIG